MISFRPMTETDLPQVEDWLHEPHVARWWVPNTTSERWQTIVGNDGLESASGQITLYRRRIRGDDTATIMLVVEDEGRSIGWCQWYRWADYPLEGEAVGAMGGEVGIDYAIGDRAMIGRGVGTRMIAALVEAVRRQSGEAGVLVTPDAANVASRRVLEKNGFVLVAVRPVATEPTEAPMAIYRLPASA